MVGGAGGGLCGKGTLAPAEAVSVTATQLVAWIDQKFRVPPPALGQYDAWIGSREAAGVLTFQVKA
jgi:hypothetical protein